jgi:hypothetical protein
MSTLQIGMKEYRRREEAGELLYKPRQLDDRAELLVVPSREAGRSVSCRVFRPPADRETKGVLLHSKLCPSTSSCNMQC